jgi:hypothetical protein
MQPTLFDQLIDHARRSSCQPRSLVWHHHSYLGAAVSTPICDRNCPSPNKESTLALEGDFDSSPRH